VGLRNNGRRVLTLADMHTIGGPLDNRGPEREVELHLTGNMERYAWSLDGLSSASRRPFISAMANACGSFCTTTP
jgi:FtsP/CotA-like multicopper oxidase with cupredoxin domain